MYQVKNLAKMLKNTTLDKLLNFVKSRPLLVVFLLAIVYQSYTLYSVGIRRNGDTPSYIKAGEVLMNGDIDTFRAPCHPFLFALGDVLIPGNSDKFVVMVQIIVFFLSIIPFNRIMQKIGIKKNITWIITILYALSPTISHYNVNVWSEPMALYFSIFWLYCFVDWWQNYKWQNIVGLGLCMLYLVFLRPSFLYLLVAMCIVACIYLLVRQYKRFLQIGGVVLLVGCAVYVYCKKVEEKIGVFTISTVTDINDYATTYHIGLLTCENVANEKIKQDIIRYETGKEDPGWCQYHDFPVWGDVPNREIHDAIRQIKSRYKWEWYLKCIKYNVADTFSKPSITYSNDWLSFRVIWPFVFVVGAYIVCDWIKRRRVPIIALTLWLMCMGNLGVNILGSFAEWNRLFLPSYPVILILIAMCCNLFKIKLNQRALRASEECN
jgi:hypothetical protein